MGCSTGASSTSGHSADATPVHRGQSIRTGKAIVAGEEVTSGAARATSAQTGTRGKIEATVTSDAGGRGSRSAFGAATGARDAVIVVPNEADLAFGARGGRRRSAGVAIGIAADSGA